MIASYLQTNVSMNCLQNVSMSCLQLCRWIVSKNRVDELSCRWIVSIPFLTSLGPLAMYIVLSTVWQCWIHRFSTLTEEEEDGTTPDGTVTVKSPLILFWFRLRTLVPCFILSHPQFQSLKSEGFMWRHWNSFVAVLRSWPIFYWEMRRKWDSIPQIFSQKVEEYFSHVHFQFCFDRP